MIGLSITSYGANYVMLLTIFMFLFRRIERINAIFTVTHYTTHLQIGKMKAFTLVIGWINCVKCYKNLKKLQI